MACEFWVDFDGLLVFPGVPDPYPNVIRYHSINTPKHHSITALQATTQSINHERDAMNVSLETTQTEIAACAAQITGNGVLINQVRHFLFISLNFQSKMENLPVFWCISLRNK